MAGTSQRGYAKRSASKAVTAANKNGRAPRKQQASG